MAKSQTKTFLMSASTTCSVKRKVSGSDSFATKAYAGTRVVSVDRKNISSTATFRRSSGSITDGTKHE